MAEVFINCDIGRLQDFTAISVVWVKYYDRKLVTGGVAETNYDPRDVIPVFEVPLLERFQGPYRQTLQRLEEIYNFPSLYLEEREIVLDATGVGDAVLEMGMEMNMEITPVVITGGDNARVGDDRWYVPRKELIDALVVAYQSRRIRVSPDIDKKLTDQLTTEMNNLQIKRNPETARETYEAIMDAKHDDIAMSLSMGIWRGMQDHQREITYNEYLEDTKSGYGDDELAAWGLPV